MEEMEYLIQEKKRNIKLINNMLEIMGRFKYGSDGIDVKEILRGIIDNDEDKDLVNTAKYCHYWLEKADYIDDPQIHKYNDYKE